METTTHRTQIYLTSEQYVFLCNQAEKKSLSIAEIIRQLINEKMPKDKDYENNPLFHLGGNRLAMGRKRGSLNHDEYLYRGKK
jgi:hypothetical protein